MSLLFKPHSSISVGLEDTSWDLVTGGCLVTCGKIVITKITHIITNVTHIVYEQASLNVNPPVQKRGSGK